MPDPRLTPDDRLHLFEKVVVGELTPSEQAKLAKLLKESPAARAEFRQYMSLHVELAGAVRLERARQNIYDEIRERASVVSNDTSSDTSRIDSPMQEPVSMPRPSRGSRVTWLPAIIAAGLAAAVLVMVNRGPIDPEPAVNTPIAQRAQETEEPASMAGSRSKRPAPVATLASTRNAVWSGKPLADGQAMNEGQTITLKSGEANVSMGYGAEMVLHGPSSLKFLTLDRVQLIEGDVAVQVAKWARGFTVVTDSMEVVDLGTTFTVSAQSNGDDQTRVISGLVRVHPKQAAKSSRRGLLVKEGESMAVDREGHVRAIPVTAEQLAKSFNFPTTPPYKPVALHNSGFDLSEGDEDPHWRVIAGPEKETQWPVYASVCPAHVQYLPNDREMSQWISIADWMECEATSVYTFQTTFDLDGYDLSTIQLFGRFLADNGIQDVRVNGVSVEVKSWRDNELHQLFGDQEFRYVNVTNGLKQRWNTIEIDVFNGTFMAANRALEGVPNPMALRVEWYAFGRQTEQSVEDKSSTKAREAHDSGNSFVAVENRLEPNN
ncbi:hypothetical protein [Aeoliella sp. SH292]|uniref:hypothetical protein n=1 Tax=Aeoliella sp. SH292 TaxID=3454464 RepID=UPI003F986352